MSRQPHALRIGVFALIAVMPVASASAQVPPSDDDAQAAIDRSPRHGEWVSIDGPGAPLGSWVMYPERSDKAPVVIVVHPGRDLGAWARAVADQLAADGYIAIAPELNDTGSAEDRAGALDAVRDYALRIPAANGGIAVMGFGRGGTAAFEYALAQPALDAAVVFYGNVPDNLDRSRCGRAPVLGLFAGNDSVAIETIERAGAALKRLGMLFEYEIYEGATAGFVSARGASGANDAATRKAWPRALAFLQKHVLSKEQGTKNEERRGKTAEQVTKF